MTRRLGKLIVGTYVLPIATFALPVWGYLAKTKADRGLRWATKTHYLNLTALGVRSLNATIN